jgi:hypothetical protein
MTKRSRTIAIKKPLKHSKELPDLTCYYDGEKCTKPDCEHNSTECPEWTESQLNYWRDTEAVSMKSYKTKPVHVNHFINCLGRKSTGKTSFPHRVFVNGNLIEVTD